MAAFERLFEAAVLRLAQVESQAGKGLVAVRYAQRARRRTPGYRTQNRTNASLGSVLIHGNFDLGLTGVTRLSTASPARTYSEGRPMLKAPIGFASRCVVLFIKSSST
jgi:hypothetical protein